MDDRQGPTTDPETAGPQPCRPIGTGGPSQAGNVAAATGTNGDGDAELAPVMFTEQQVINALNRAADDILDAVEAGDEGARDALNLVVNSAAAYLRGSAADLQDVVQQSYDADYSTVLSWIRTAIR
jgi:hypothetical protein